MAKVTMAQGDKGVMETLGDDWGRQQAANILGTLAGNPGAGGVGAMGAGMGMGMAAGGIFGNMANQMFAPMNPQQPAAPVQPGPSGRFAPKNSAAPAGTAPVAQEDPIEVLAKLKKMLDLGIIEQSDYDAKKAEVISRM